MLLDEIRQAPIDLLPDFARHHRFERRIGDFQREVARRGDGRESMIVQSGSRSVPLPRRPESARLSSIGFWVAERPMRCKTIAAERSKPLKGKRQMAAALVRPPARGFRPRSRSGWSRACGGRTPSQAGCKATPAS